MNVYKDKDVYRASLHYFDGDELAADVFTNKYALKNEKGEILELTPEDMHRRLACEFARMERKYPNAMTEDEIFSLLDGFKYIVPQGSPMTGIGNDHQVVSLSNCFVIDSPADSYGGIMRADQELVQIMKRRGGNGLNLSNIRPNGTRVKNAAHSSTGPVAFMKRYSNSTREVAQDGRRGALMITMSIEHPDVEDFIDAKLDRKEITGANISVMLTDEFIEAAKNNKKYIHKWPVGSNDSVVTKEIFAKKLWDKIIHNAWSSAEPGILMWDTILKESVPDCYAEFGYNTVATNPCVVGDTLVSVADGRGYVSIRELAEEGVDVPVYCLDENDRLTIRKMRNPRITGFNKKIYKVTIEGGHEMRVTGNHRVKLTNGKYIRVDQLKSGDSLFIMNKQVAAFNDIFKGLNSKSSDYYWLSTSNNRKYVPEHRIIANHFIGDVDNKVVHHIDRDGMNNCYGNLQIMNKEDHDKLHAKDMMGRNNPMFKIKEDPDKLTAYSHKMSKVTTGEKNGRYSGISNDELISCGVELCKKLGRRFSKKEWYDYAADNKLLKHLGSRFRGGYLNFSKTCANIYGSKFVDKDPRVLRTYIKAISDGYSVDITGNNVMVIKTCENCQSDFQVNYYQREISFCSHICSLEKINSDKSIKEKRTNSINAIYFKKGEITKSNQLKIYSDLKFRLKRNPVYKEWYDECINNGVSGRLKTKYGFDNFKELKEQADLFNHKVVSVVEDGYDDVYNGTVDDYHNFFSGGFEEVCSVTGKTKYVNINQLQCGEIPLSPYDSCRLMAINLYSYVVNPFTKDAYFDFDLFRDHAQKAMKLMDDLIDLEIEKIDKILAKIGSDAESHKDKAVEVELWQKIRQQTLGGRRTGLGITGEGDMLAALGLRYGTREATEFSVEVHRNLATFAYVSSIDMARDRGQFEYYNVYKEQSNPFVQRIMESMTELSPIHVDLMKRFGRRNMALLTVAPTGSTSIMTRTTSGLEPSFLISYKRKRKINKEDKGAGVDCTDESGDMWQEYNVFHPKFFMWAKVNGYDPDELTTMNTDDLQKVIEKSPYFGATSADVDWGEKVYMQGAVQKWVDHSISVTINLPENISEDLVGDLYMKAWECGCKGLTVYREGSRDAVLSSGKKHEEKKLIRSIRENQAPKRPKVLECEVIQFWNQNEKWIGFLSKLEGRPFEIFTGRLSEFPVPKYVKQGEISKVKDNGHGTRYDFMYVDKNNELVIAKGLNRVFDPEYWNYAKMTSGLLQYGMPVVNVAELLGSLSLPGEINTWLNGVVRMFKKYIQNGTKSKQKCHECGQEALVYQEGCLTCANCGHAKCG